MTEPHPIQTLAKGLVGFSSSGLALLTSMQEQVKWWLQCASLVVGLVVGILTVISLVRGMMKRKG